MVVHLFNKSKLSPIILFVYNRPNHTRKTVEALQKNQLASESDLYVFADGPKDDISEEQLQSIKDVRSIINNITGFKSVNIEVSNKNKGLANSIIYGVTKIISIYGRVIVLEDDIITHPFFLRFMNDALEKYRQDYKIFMISGFSHDIRIPLFYLRDVYIVSRCCSWGWATWANRWKKANWDINTYDIFNSTNVNDIIQFNKGGNDLYQMLKMQKENKIDSWAIRWQYCMYKQHGYTLHTKKTYAKNIGFDGSGIHCTGYVDPANMPADYPSLTKYCIHLPQNIKAKKQIEISYKRTIDHLPTLSERICYSIHKRIEKLFIK